MSYFFTSESVSEGHPDKVSDQISDALLDNFIAFDSDSKVACETLVTTGQAILAGEVKSNTYLDVQTIARETINRIGYTKDEYQFSGNSCGVISLIHEQSQDINRGVDRDEKENQGAGDQGIMFGYACNDNDAYLPAPIYYAHEVLKELKSQRQHVLGPDAKSQVSVQYDGGRVQRIDQVVISTQHGEGQVEQARNISKLSAMNVLGDLIDSNTIWHLNPTGNFVIGGPDGDAGVTGRKIIVDTYGGFAPHGGGAFSGKDPTKVDRSAAYMARWLAKNVVADEMADWCNIQLSYAIGVKQPTSIYVESNGYSKSIEKFIRDNIDLSPKGIIDRFDMFNFYNYSENCVYGHFGDKDVPWEKIGW